MIIERVFEAQCAYSIRPYREITPLKQKQTPKRYAYFVNIAMASLSSTVILGYLMHVLTLYMLQVVDILHEDVYVKVMCGFYDDHKNP